jgi:hypothetical protein
MGRPQRKAEGVKLLKIIQKTERGERRIMRKAMCWSLMVFLLMPFGSLVIPGESPAAEGVPRGGLMTEQEVAAEKFFSNLEATLGEKFFDYRKRPTIRVAIFEFTDEAGNVVKSGRELADRLTKHLYLRPQFEVLSQQKIDLYLKWNGLNTLGKVDAESLRRLQRRINTMDPGNNLHALVMGEVKKGIGRSLRVSASLVNFQFKIGAIELEKNIIDRLALITEIPLPTEQALQEAMDILVHRESGFLEEGRLVILVNSRGNALFQSEYVSRFSKDQPFPWAKIPYALTLGREEVIMPDQIRIGFEKLPLTPLPPRPDAGRQLEYFFLHGKCATNETYFDEVIPAQSYHLITSFLDRKNNEPYSELTEVPVYPGATTIVVITFYMPSERERIRNKATPRIDVFTLFGKGIEILSN